MSSVVLSADIRTVLQVR